MQIRIHIAAPVIAGLAAIAIPAAAQDAPSSLPTIKAEAVFYATDCARRVLPSQRAVGEWTGQHNFGQVYDTRERLMGEIARACQRPGIERVQVVSRLPAPTRDLHLVAFATRSGD